MNILFFLLPFFLYLGIAAQAFSYYLICILVPFSLFFYHKQKIPNYFTKIGLAFLLLHIIFPVINFLVYFFPNLSLSASIYKIKFIWPGILRSNFPSELFFGGLAIILLSIMIKKTNKSFNTRFFVNIETLKYFLFGLAPASVLFVSLFLFCHYTGLDARSIVRTKLEYFSQSEAFANGRFRVCGFYGHPLTLAAVCLIYTIFSWTIICLYFRTKQNPNWNFFFIKKNPNYSIILLLISTFTNELGLILSGGRSAIIIGIALLIIIPLYLNLRKNFFVTLLVVLAIMFFSVMLIKKVGVLNRITDSAVALKQKHNFEAGNYRQYFWRVYVKMFYDKPLLGQGNYWLQQGVLDAYYTKLGYEDLPEKYIAHNNYLEVLGSAGILGLGWLIALITYLIRVLRNNLFSKNNYLTLITKALIFAFIANLLHSLTQNVFFDSSVVYIYLSLLLIFMWDNAAKTILIQNT